MVSIKSLIVATFAVGLVSSAPTGTLDKRWGPIYCETSGGSPWSGDVSNAARQFQGTVAASSGAPGCMAIGRSAGSAQIGLCSSGFFRPPSAIDLQIMILNLNNACQNSGKAGGRIRIGDGDAQVYVYHA